MTNSIFYNFLTLLKIKAQKFHLKKLNINYNSTNIFKNPFFDDKIK